LVYFLVCVVGCWFFVLVGAVTYRILKFEEKPGATARGSDAVAVKGDVVPERLIQGARGVVLGEEPATVEVLSAEELGVDVPPNYVAEGALGVDEFSIGLVVMAHNRPEYLKPVLAGLLGLLNIDAVTVYVSMDDPKSFDTLTALVAEASLEFSVDVQVWQQRHDVISYERPQSNFEKTGLFKIAAHFKKALARGFADGQHTHLILLEDDLVAAPDFLTLFLETAHLLTTDPSLFCVSAWHDNGRGTLVRDDLRLFRTGFFPGMGWMLTRALWEELEPVWPVAATTGWDYWLRLDAHTKGRHCIVPEVPRVKHIALKGTSVGTKEAKRFTKFGFAARSIAPS
jgi:hypothetical protein